MINWKVRIKNKQWWLYMIPAVLILINAVAKVFGYDLDFSILGEQLETVIRAAFTLLALLGVISDPTTKGYKDGELGSRYISPGVLPDEE